jgi:2-keto-4-pentenoate hydratase
LTTITRAVRTAFERLDEAARSGIPCAPVRDLIGESDVDAAYAVQTLFREEALVAGRQRSGRKIGLTSPAVQRQLGVDQPDFGQLFDDMQRAQDRRIPASEVLQARIEAEVAFILGADLDGEITTDSVRSAVAYALPALEIVGSRVAGWNIRITDTIADNASSGLYVLGRGGASLCEFEPAATRMNMTRDGVEVSSGMGTDCLGDPLHALAWLARAASRYGDPLRAGEVVLSGALGPMVDVVGGSTYAAHISGLGTVHASFVREEA